MPNQVAISTAIAASTTLHGRTKDNNDGNRHATGFAFFSNMEKGPTIVDTNSPAITTIVKGRELAEMIIDGGSGVNVISLRTCDTLGIQD